MYRSLREFLSALDEAGELHRITAKVSPMLEISEIADRVSKSPAPSMSEAAARTDPRHHHLGGKALLFENVEGSSMPVAINVFGSYRRMEMALGCTDGGFKALAARIEAIVKPEPPATFVDKLKKIPQLMEIARTSPKIVSNAPCQQVVKTGNKVDLFELPMIKCWPLDGDPSAFGYPFELQQPGEGRYITFGGVHTIHPDDAAKQPGTPRPSRNIGMYRAQLLDRNHTAMHWHVHHDGARHWRAWKNRQQESGGNDSHARGMPCAIALGGESVLPYAATAPLPPGISEFMMAGLLNNGGIPITPCKTVPLEVPVNAEIVIEGWVSTQAGGPGVEGQQSQSLEAGHNTGLSTRNFPAFDSQHEHFEGPFGDHTGYYSLPDRYPVFEVTAITHRTAPIYPTTIVGLPPQEDYYMGKATERIFLPLLQTLIPDIIDYDLPMFGAFHNCAFVQIRKEYALQARRVMHAIWGAGQMAWTKMIVVVDDDVNVHDHEAVLFHLCANCDPGRDLEIVNGPLDILDHAAPHLGAGHKIGFDATRKIKGEEVAGHPIRDWPTVIQMDPQVRAFVDRRWGEYGFE
jgi:4-hydroxy-3-polyprenylbenzoate decarboxylase